MKRSKYLKLVVFVPVDHTQKVREAIHKAGAGQGGDYADVSYSGHVINRYIPEPDANPDIGETGEQQIVEEERIEFLCKKEIIADVVVAMKKAHPYEEVAYDILERFDIS